MTDNSPQVLAGRFHFRDPDTAPFLDVENKREFEGTAGGFGFAPPSKTAPGDLVLLVISTQNTSNPFVIEDQPGWNLIGRAFDGGIGSLYPEVAAFWRVATDSEPATYSFNLASSVPLNAVMYRVSGFDPENPVGSIVSEHDGVGSTIPLESLPGTKLGLMVGAAVSRSSSASLISQDMETLVHDNPSSSPSTWIASEEIGRGLTGDRSFTVSTANRTAGLMFVINPDPSRELLISSDNYRDAELGNFRPLIAEDSDPEFELSVAPPHMDGKPNTSFSTVRLLALEGGLDSLAEADFEGATLELRVGAASLAWDSLSDVYFAAVERAQFVGEQYVDLTMRSRVEDLVAPYLVREFEAGEVEADMEGERVPTLLGYCRQIPAPLIDSTVEDHFIADNLAIIGRVSEGGTGNDIVEGGSAGQYQTIDNGFSLNSKPDLAVTADAGGPLRPLTDYRHSLFLEWKTESGKSGGTYEVPDGWDYQGLDVDQYVERFNGEAAVRVHVDSTADAVYMVYDAPGVAVDLRLRIRFRYLPGITNTGRIILETGDTGSWTNQATVVHDVEADGDLLEVEFSVTAGDRSIRIGFETVGTAIRYILESVELEHTDQAAVRIDQLVPYALAIRYGRPWSEIGWDSLEALAAADHPDHELGAWINDGQNAVKVMDLLIAAMGATWWYDRLGVFRCGRLEDPEGETPVLEIGPHNRMGEISRVHDLAPGLVTRWNFQANQYPIPEDRQAEALSSGQKRTNARDFRSWHARSPKSGTVAGLAPMYRGAVGREPRAVARDSHEGISNLVAAVLELYHVPRSVYVDSCGIDAADLETLEPFSVVRIKSERFGLQDGKLCRVIGVRGRPFSGSVELTLWG